MRTCVKCLRELPLDQFYKNKTRRDGYYPRCRNCWNEYMKAWHEVRRKKRAAEREAQVVLSIRARQRTPQPDPGRLQEPDLSEEVVEVQERMIEQFGVHTGERRRLGYFNERLSQYGMEVCRGCGKVHAHEFACTNCDNGQAVIIR